MSDSTYIVYLITDPYTGKQYAGQTKNKLGHRLSGHVTSVRQGHMTEFGHAIAKYGIKNFTVSVLREGMTKEQADEEEKLAIRTLHLINKDFGYNMTKGGDGCVVTEEIRIKMRENNVLRRWDVKDEDIIALYQSGKTMQNVAEQFGMTLGGIWWRLKNAGIKRRHGKELPEDEVVNLYRDGHTQKGIAAILGVSESPIYRTLKKHGIKCARKRLSLSESAIEMYKSGMSTKSIGEKFGKSAPFIAKNLREMGVVLNLKGGWKDQKRPSKTIPDEAVKLYLEGYSFAELGKMYGFTDAGIRIRLIKLGVVPRGVRGSRRITRPKKYANIEKA